MNNQDKKYTVIRRLVQYFKMQEEQPTAGEIDREWELVRQKMDRTDWAAKRRSRVIASFSAAAVILIAVAIGITTRVGSPADDMGEIAARLSEITVDGDEIKLVVSSEEILPVKKNATVSYSEDGLIIVDDEPVLPQTSGTEDMANQYNTLIVPKGQYTQLQLADGSRLHVNSGTKVVYPRIFGKNRREIFVDGEVYCNVTRDEAAPFIVRTNNFEIDVLGTTFNVNAYSEDAKAEVVLVNGSINIRNSAKESMVLAPNELITIDAGKLQQKRRVDVSSYISWIDGLLMLNDTPLGILLQRLDRYYGTDIEVDPSVRDLLIHGNLYLNNTLPEILRRLSVTAPISIHETESGFYIKPRE